MPDIITIHSNYRGNYEIPVNFSKWNREEGCKDIILVKQAVEIGIPLSVYLSIRTDGEIRLVKTAFQGNSDSNHYYHLYAGEEKQIPTAAQEKAIAAIWADKVAELGIAVSDDTPPQILHGVGATPQKILRDSISNILARSYSGTIAVA